MHAAPFMYVLNTTAYIGPGAGFAFLGSFLLLATALLFAAFAALSFPLRVVYRLFVRKSRAPRGAARRVVVLGFDGMDPERTRALMAAGQLPHLSALAARGTFSPLATTQPPLSPVAWSSFSTGTNPGKHNIFDFLNRNLRTCLPELSSCRINTRRTRLGRRKAVITLLRKSKPFWHILGEYGVFSTILRVPVTFPPERFGGLLLSAMCVPDLRGSQGTFTVYETSGNNGTPTGGARIRVQMQGRRILTHLPGPTDGARTLQAALRITLARGNGSVTLRTSGQTVRLQPNVYSDWVRVRFGRGLRSASGICRFLLLSPPPDFRLYVTPVNIDPERPAMPISHPAWYAVYLAKLIGPFATLGLAEDTWGLNEHVLDDAAFLRQVYDIHREREAMFTEALKRTRRGLCCCVFDLTDRVQHTFFRYTDAEQAAQAVGPQREAIDDAYRACDALVGRTLKALDDDTVLLAMSDHGFASFRWGVNLNAWLRQEGFLSVKEPGSSREYLANVDWEKTRAYSFGLSGIYLNLAGREARGVVPESERRAVKEAIAAKLANLTDPRTGRRAVRAVYDSETIYTGPYRNNGPDLVVGYEPGYRASWETAVGRTDGDVLVDNEKCWSGDHCVDASAVPGVLFCNRRLAAAGRTPHITDLAPTILSLFGIPPPGYMDGRILDLEPRNTA